ncbi:MULTISPECIES: hypothetical protein [unclassified Paenibacillus]|uniref:hypothetical protein n=1 Tax=unclassified Paenibacillus TaxID=185978 RepID=UPI000B2EB3C0|nr:MULTISPECIES: hypothetical protein [unclassified Paenibacillus]MCT1399792.1 hypothetical protein [Paenibacillus sp. p3-SID867]
MKTRKRPYLRSGQILIMAVMTMMLMVACTKEVPGSVSVQQNRSTSATPSAGEAGNASEMPPPARESLRTAFHSEEQSHHQVKQEVEPPAGESNHDPIEAVLNMYEALQANDSASYFRHADIASVRMSPAMLKVLFEEAGKREVRPERFKLFDKEGLDRESRQLLSLTYGSQAEVVLEELSQGDHNLWFVTAFPDGLKVVEQSTIYPGAYELGREATMEELIAIEIRHTAEDRTFLAAKAKQPVWNPVQTVSLLYQAAQAEDAETFYAMSGGDEGYFSGQYARDMVEFTEWMRAFESVQHISIESVPQENLAGSYREEYNKSFGDAWQFIVAWDPKDEAGYQGTYWIMAPGEDGIRYVVKQTLTANLESFFR